MNQIKPLTIYSASAGSGKTFNLVQKYLQLVLSESEKSVLFSKIIAMTFTNKAAWEMKERIIQALDVLAFSENLSEENQEKRLDFLTLTSAKLQMDPVKVQERAKQVLVDVLHQYETFQVLTIDKFSLRLIRSFARDLNINDDFEVILNEGEIIEKVIDELLSKIGNPNYDNVTKLALDFAKSNLADGEKWNFRRQLISFATVLRKENDQQYIALILNQKFTPELHDDLREKCRGLKASFERIKNVLLDYFKSLNCIAEDFPRKNQGLYGLLSSKLSETGVNDEIPINTYTSKTLTGELIKPEHNVPQTLIDATIRFLEEAKPIQDRFFVVDNLRKNFHNLALLKYVASELNEIKERDNIVMISEFNKMISDLLTEENADYIYERIGTRFESFLLDEFQDTSRLQLLNLLPLVHNSISENKDVFIVGDPKQAIYRFRNGLVQQFAALPSIYNPDNHSKLAEQSHYFESLGEKHSLKDNWRSSASIVDFNNKLFSRAKDFLPNEYQSYYSDVEQSIKSKQLGYVEIDNSSYDSDSKLEKQQSFLLESIRKCEEDGYKRGDICLLARSKKEGKQWAKWLNEAPENYKVVSADSLTVNSDKTVKVFIDYLYLLRNNANPSNRIKFVVNLLTLKGEEPLLYLANYWVDGKVGQLHFETFVKDYFQDNETLFFNYENLYDLGQQFARLIRVNELNNPYVHHLMEMLQNFDLQMGPDLRGFIDFWETQGKEETVQMPENDDAIQIMTVHKAKGLEFPVVILPNLEWEFSKVKDAHFVEVENINTDVLYTKLVKEKVPDFIIDKYQAERNNMLLDEFNLLYVALTRPVDRLYLKVQSKTSSSGEINNIARIVSPICEELVKSKFLTRKEQDILIAGEATPKSTKKEISSDNFYPKDISDLLWFPDIALQDDDALDKESINEEVRFGLLVHDLVAKTSDLEQIDSHVLELVKQDQIDNVYAEKLRRKLKEIISFPAYNSLLNEAEKVLTEASIIVNEEQTLRPDLIIEQKNETIIIDFKTGAERSTHFKQIENYRKTLIAMGYKNVTGYLYYTQNLVLKKVS